MFCYASKLMVEIITFNFYSDNEEYSAFLKKKFRMKKILYIRII
jgi:hypothetical protein